MTLQQQLHELKKEIEINGFSTVGSETLEKYAQLSVQYWQISESGPINSVVRMAKL
jgi:hypothetical protein